MECRYCHITPDIAEEFNKPECTTGEAHEWGEWIPAKSVDVNIQAPVITSHNIVVIRDETNA